MEFTPGAQQAPCGVNQTSSGKGPHDSVPMLADDTAITFRIFLDGVRCPRHIRGIDMPNGIPMTVSPSVPSQVVGEVYFQDGRVAMTVPLRKSADSDSDGGPVEVVLGGGAKLINATSHAVGDSEYSNGLRTTTLDLSLMKIVVADSPHDG